MQCVIFYGGGKRGGGTRRQFVGRRYAPTMIYQSLATVLKHRLTLPSRLRKKSVNTLKTTQGLKPGLITCALRGPEGPLFHGNLSTPGFSAACYETIRCRGFLTQIRPMPMSSGPQRFNGYSAFTAGMAITTGFRCRLRNGSTPHCVMSAISSCQVCSNWFLTSTAISEGRAR